ncbi:MAG: nitroreductase family protein [Oscillospiraceae bacterium]|nr:nitroreductase family protein [Oscillospiraceae bacterium]
MGNNNPVEISSSGSNELIKGFAEFREYDEPADINIKTNFDFLALSKSRRSIRGFKEKDVSKEQLMKLIDAAQSAPSGGNCQPWHFYVIKNKKLQSEIKEKSCGQDWILTAPAFIVVCSESRRSEKNYGERGRDLYSVQDTAAAIQNILLCAKSMGLGTCWCGAFNEEKLKEVLNLPEAFRPVGLIPVGYPANDSYPPQNRRPIEEIVTFIE